jgi:hypothetical protein
MRKDKEDMYGSDKIIRIDVRYGYRGLDLSTDGGQKN